VLFGMVVEKAAHEPYVNDVHKALLKPLGVKNRTLAPNSQVDVDPSKVAPDDPYTGPSDFDLSSSARQHPFNYERDDIIWERVRICNQASQWPLTNRQVPSTATQ
jgi:hypothetical protein